MKASFGSADPFITAGVLKEGEAAETACGRYLYIRLGPHFADGSPTIFLIVDKEKMTAEYCVDPERAKHTDYRRFTGKVTLSF